MSSKILYITSSLPSLTLTFIYREIIALESLGVEIDIVSMNRPEEDRVSAEARSFLDRILFLDRIRPYRLAVSQVVVLVTRPLRFVRALLLLFRARPRNGLRDFARLAYHFVEAVHLCRLYSNIDYRHIHAHFVSGPSSIALFLSELSAIPFSFTMHGSQIYIDPIGLATKLEKCRFAASISDYHRQFVVKQYNGADGGKIHVVRCGIDMAQVPAVPRRVRSAGSFSILGVGRLVEVKGFEYLLRACARLDEKNIDYVCRIVGDGELHDSLHRLAAELCILDRVSFEGAKRQAEVQEYYMSADVFCLPCIVAADGSRDGLPVVLMEAMSWQLPVVSSRLVGIPELIESHQHGILVEPRDIDGLADAIGFVHDHQDLARQWGSAGREKVASSFSVGVSALQMKKLFFGEKQSA